MGELLTINEAAGVLGLHRNTVSQLVKAGRLRTVKIINGRRITRESVESFVAPHDAPATIEDTPNA